MVMGSAGYYLVTAMFLLLVCLCITDGRMVVCPSGNISNDSYLFHLLIKNGSNCSFSDIDEWIANNTSYVLLLNGTQIDKRVTGPGLPPPGWVRDANLPNMSDNSTKIL